MMSRILDELEQVLKEEVRRLAVGEVQDLGRLLQRKLELIYSLRQEPQAVDRARLAQVWRQNRSLLKVIEPFAPDRIPSAASRQQGGWRG